MVQKAWGAAALAVAVVAVGQPAWAQSAGAEVGFARGSVRGAVAPASSWQELSPGAKLLAGDALKTGADGVVSLRLPQGGSMSLGPNGVLRLQDLNGGLSGRLLAGKARLTGPSAGENGLLAGALRLVAGPGADAMVEKAGAGWRVVGLAGTVGVVQGAEAPTLLDGGQAATFQPGAAPQMASAAGEVPALRALFAEAAASRPTSNPNSGNNTASRPVGGDRLWATGLSALVPGVGQLYAGELPRGLAYLGLEFAFLGAGAYGKWTNQALWSSVAAGGLVGLNVISPLDAWFLTPDPKRP